MLELWELNPLGSLKQHKEIRTKLTFIFFKVTLATIIIPIFINKNDIYLLQNNTDQTF